MKRILFVATLAVAFSPCACTFGTVAIDTVPVGDAGNPNDPADGNDAEPVVEHFGAVSYPYSIGKNEVTVGQYTAFLNAVAATDTYGLYNNRMATDLNSAGISRNLASGRYTYSVIGSPNHPVTYVNRGDAARFANWLHNGQPTGGQDKTTTEDGAYTLNGLTGDLVVTRNPNARWFIPSENEWYKAAYYQPAASGGDSDSYWAYPMKTNSMPYSDRPPGATPDNTRVGNFDGPGGYALTGTDRYSTSQNYLTDVGAYLSSPSYYGTFDQGGSVFEWYEYDPSTPSLGFRGGAWSTDSSFMLATQRGFTGLLADNSTIGFRVATIFVPEPATCLLALLGCVAYLSRRFR